MKGHVMIKLIVNCKGRLANPKVIKTADSNGVIESNTFASLAPQIMDILDRELRWTPAYQNGRAVDFLHIFSIWFDSGMVRMRMTGVD